MRTKSPLRIAIVAAAVMVIWVITPMAAFGYPVEPLPEDNLIVNPWFRSADEPSVAGTDGWVVVTVDGVGWGKSQKETNPSPDIVISGVCGFQEVYCGTGMRWAHSQSKGEIEKHPNLDVYFFQIVQADPGQRKLKFSMHWVNHKIDIFEVVVYGSESADGPWVPVWEIIRITQDQNPPPGEAPGRLRARASAHAPGGGRGDTGPRARDRRCAAPG